MVLASSEKIYIFIYYIILLYYYIIYDYAYIHVVHVEYTLFVCIYGDLVTFDGAKS